MIPALAWKEQSVIVPVGDDGKAARAAGVRVIEADAGDGGTIRAAISRQHGVIQLEVHYVRRLFAEIWADPSKVDEVTKAELSPLRWPTMGEVYAALDKLVPPGTTLALMLASQREPRVVPPDTQSLGLVLLQLAAFAVAPGGGRVRR